VVVGTIRPQRFRQRAQDGGAQPVGAYAVVIMEPARGQIKPGEIGIVWHRNLRSMKLT
jgi:hypothetical protein